MLQKKLLGTTPDMPAAAIPADAIEAANSAAAQTPPKMSRAAAQYQDRPRGGVSCIACTFFRKPDICQVVEGTVSPNGWCRLFDMPD